MKIIPLVTLLMLVFFGVVFIFHLLKDFISTTNVIILGTVLYHDYIVGLLLVGVGQGITMESQATLEMSNRKIHLKFLITY